MYCYLLTLLFLNSIFCERLEIFEIKNQFEKTNISNKKNYPLVTLGYVTPWNKEGYNFVEKYSNKFDIISPTWFELKPEEIDGEFQIILDGSNNIDEEFMERLRNKNKNILILPRLHVSFNDKKYFNIWFTKESSQFVKVLERRLKYNNFDGYVFDCINIWYDQTLFNQFINNLLPKIHESMKKLKKKLIISIIPKFHKKVGGFLNKEIFKRISKYVDYINIMTYDYHQYAEDNKKFYLAPISWIKETIDFYVDKNDANKKELLKKILFGLPFHGYMYDKGKGSLINPLNTKQLYDIINKAAANMMSLNSDEEEYEYSLNFQDGFVIPFPVMKYIEERLKLSEELNLGGTGIWDIGNGKEGLLEPF